MNDATTTPGSKADQVHRVLRERISSGDYPAGYRLVLTRLAQDLGVGVVPVREAVRTLEAEGLVRFERHVGATVTGIDAAAYTDAMETLAYLEGVATMRSAPHLTPTDLAGARDLNERMRHCLTTFDPVEFTRLNQAFHEVLIGRCPNTHLLDLVHREWDRLGTIRRSTFGLIPGRPTTSLLEHDRLVDLIAAGAAPETVEQAARGHKLGTLGAFRERARPR